MPGRNSLSIIVPALDEEEKLDWSVRTAVEVARRYFDEIEVLILDDGSTDRTGQIADALAAEIPEVRAYHHPRPSGLGGALKRGLQLARMHYFFWVDGKGATPAEALDLVFSNKGRADLVVLYAVNPGDRPLIRRIIASIFRNAVNFLFCLRLRQHTHPVLCRTETLRQVEVRTSSYAFQAEALVKMIKGGCSYVEIGVRDDFSRQREHSKVFRLRNILGVAAFFARLLYEIRVKHVHRKIPVRSTT